MTGAQLAYIRARRGLTTREFADEIGDISHTTILRWEKEPDSVIPSWVTERIIGKTVIPLPMEDLHALLDYTRATGKGFSDILSEAIREYLASKAAPENITQLPAAPAATYEPLADIDGAARVAEDPAS